MECSGSVVDGIAFFSFFGDWLVESRFPVLWKKSFFQCILKDLPYKWAQFNSAHFQNNCWNSIRAGSFLGVQVHKDLLQLFCVELDFGHGVLSLWDSRW